MRFHVRLILLGARGAARDRELEGSDLIALESLCGSGPSCVRLSLSLAPCEI